MIGRDISATGLIYLPYNMQLISYCQGELFQPLTPNWVWTVVHYPIVMLDPLRV